MQYDPKDAVTVWPEVDGQNQPIEYSAVLANVVEKTSKKGNPMEVWTFEVYNSMGQTRTIEEFVVVPGAVFKIKQLAKALSKEADFNTGAFQAGDYINSNFAVYLSIEEQDGFDDKNRIKRIMAKAGTQVPVNRPARTPQPVASGAPFGDEKQFKEDDIPF